MEADNSIFKLEEALKSARYFAAEGLFKRAEHYIGVAEKCAKETGMNHSEELNESKNIISRSAFHSAIMHAEHGNYEEAIDNIFYAKKYLQQLRAKELEAKVGLALNCAFEKGFVNFYRLAISLAEVGLLEQAKEAYKEAKIPVSYTHLTLPTTPYV